MDGKTLEALHGSIAKWERIAAGEQIRIGLDTCPLCRLFHRAYRFVKDGSSCEGCPVSDAGFTRCTNPEFHNAALYASADGLLTRSQLALDEANFLRSLLPKDAP